MPADTPSRRRALVATAHVALGRVTPWLPELLAAAVLVGAITAAPAPGQARFEGVWTLGRLFAAAGAIALVGGRRLPARLRVGPWWGVASILALTLGLTALYGRDPALHLAPLPPSSATIFGFPAALGFAALTVAWRLGRAGAPGRSANAPLARGIFALGLIFSSATLCIPDDALGAPRLPLLIALEGLGSGAFLPTIGALAALGGAVAVAAGWVHLARRAWGHAAAPPALLATGTATFAGYHVLAGMASGVGPEGLLIAAAPLALIAAADHAAGAREALGDRSGRVLARAATISPVAAILATFALLKLHGFVPSNTDENIYFYMAQDLANGRLPYVDYFFAHPPMHVLVPGAFFTVFGYSLTFAKCFSAAAAAISGLAIFAIGRRQLGSRAAGILAMVLFLFATETLKASTNMTGVNLTTMWLTLGLWQSLQGQPLRAGALFGVAATTGFYSIAAVLAVLTLGCFRWVQPDGEPARGVWPRLRFGVTQIGAFVAVAGGINLAFLIAAGDRYIDGVYTYHALKGLRDPNMVPLFGGDVSFPASLLHNVGAMMTGKEWSKDVFYHAHLWIGLAVAPAMGAVAYFTRDRAPDDAGDARGAPRWLRWWSPARLFRDGPDGAIGVVWLVALALFAQFAMFRELYSFYWVLIYPTLALALSYTLVRGGELLASTLRAPQPDDDADPPRAPRGVRLARVGLVALVLVAAALHRPWGTAQMTVFGSEVEHLGARNDYVWTDAPVLAGLSELVHGAFWETHRIRGHVDVGVRHYLWTKKRAFSTLDDIADYVRERTEPHETIAGASTLAPLIALRAGRRLAAGEVDTNSKRFRAQDDDGRRLLSDEDYWRAICADDVRFIVSSRRSYFTPRRMEQLETAKRWFRPAKRFLDHELRYGGAMAIALYERVEPGPPEGGACRWEDPSAR